MNKLLIFPFRILLTVSMIIIVLITMDACQQKGCTDPNATNYDPEADKDDGSCVYNNQPQYAKVTLYASGDCFEGNVELYMDGYYQKTFYSPFPADAPLCSDNNSVAVTYDLLLGSYHFTAYSDSNNSWDFYVDLSSADACYLVALKCGGYAEGDGVSSPSGVGNLTVWSSFDFGNDISVKVNGIYRGKIRYFYTSVPGCGSSGCVTISNLTPGVYTIDAGNGTYTWSNYTVLVRDGWCNTFELK
jgi:hypothetical protein